MDEWSQGLDFNLTYRTPRTVLVQSNAPKLEVGERGVILPPPVKLTANGGLTSSSFNRKRLDASLLYWDAIEYPSSQMIEFGSPEIDALTQMGVVSRSQVQFSGRWSGGESVEAAHDAVVRELKAQSPGRWSHFLIANEGVTSAHSHEAVTVRLLENLPLPPSDLPFEELLEFRQKRIDELRELRIHVDELADLVVASSDGEAALIRKIDSLHASVRAARAVTSERFGGFIGLKIAPSFSLTDALKAGATSFGLLAVATGAPTLAAIGGAAIAASFQGLSISIEKTGGEPDLGPLKYAASIESELAR
ncbi:DUF6236 family protein [Caulobacter sp. DWR1-3-2b1]|uniref:DUF6236 family protein n=1 Tax=Caulobacter sp. DWR1-3-2b1 TaxID=2804670 RepID=UPI003CE95002